MFNDCKQIINLREMEKRKNWLRVKPVKGGEKA